MCSFVDLLSACKGALTTLFAFGSAAAMSGLIGFGAYAVGSAIGESNGEVLADPQVDHMAWIQPLELPNGVHTPTFASPLCFSGQGLPIRLRPPALGEHNDEILESLRARPDPRKGRAT